MEWDLFYIRTLFSGEDNRFIVEGKTCVKCKQEDGEPAFFYYGNQTEKKKVITLDIVGRGMAPVCQKCASSKSKYLSKEALYTFNPILLDKYNGGKIAANYFKDKLKEAGYKDTWDIPNKYTNMFEAKKLGLFANPPLILYSQPKKIEDKKTLHFAINESLLEYLIELDKYTLYAGPFAVVPMEVSFVLLDLKVYIEATVLRIGLNVFDMSNYICKIQIFADSPQKTKQIALKIKDFCIPFENIDWKKIMKTFKEIDPKIETEKWQQLTTSERICPKCGKALELSSTKFCTNCGEKL